MVIRLEIIYLFKRLPGACTGYVIFNQLIINSCVFSLEIFPVLPLRNLSHITQFNSPVITVDINEILEILANSSILLSIHHCSPNKRKFPLFSSLPTSRIESRSEGEHRDGAGIIFIRHFARAPGQKFTPTQRLVDALR